MEGSGVGARPTMEGRVEPDQRWREGLSLGTRTDDNAASPFEYNPPIINVNNLEEYK